MDDKREQSRPTNVIALTIVAFSVVLVSPGLLLTHAFDRMLGLHFDRGQLWSFGSLLSVAMLVVFCVHACGFFRGFMRYALLAFIATAFWLVARFEFHAEWPLDLWHALIG